MQQGRETNTRQVLRSPVFWLAVGFAICVALMMLNAVLYFSHPHGRGLNLFAAVWSGLMACFALSGMRAV